MVLSEGFSFSASSGVLVGGGRAKSSVMVLLSTVPLKAEGGRLVGSTEGAWMLVYEVVASRPACLRMTAPVSAIGFGN